MSRRVVAVVVAVGLALSLGIAVFAAPWASSSPDGLERVATDEGFESTAAEHVAGSSPAADYSTWAWRAVGVVVVFGLAVGLTKLSTHRRSAPVATPGSLPS